MSKDSASPVMVKVHVPASLCQTVLLLACSSGPVQEMSQNTHKAAYMLLWHRLPHRFGALVKKVGCHWHK